MNEAGQKLHRLQQQGLITGLVCLALTMLGLLFNPPAAWISYLIAYVFWFSVGLGCLNVAMIHHLAGGAWGNVTRRFFEAGYMTLPLLALLFVPILFGLRELYPWADPVKLAADKILRDKSVYENVPVFALRAAVFFAVWIEIAVWLRRWSLEQDFVSHPKPITKGRTLSGAGIVIVPFTATFAFVDWVMSIEVSWYSTIYAIILLAAGVVLTLSLGILLLAWFRDETPFAPAVTNKHFLDLGNLLLAFVMFWAYVSFSQLLIIYSGNQPHEIGWYIHRIAGTWKALPIFIAVFQFFAPFIVLLFRANKQRLRTLAAIAAVIFLVNALQNFWTIAPSFYPQGLWIHWTDCTAWLGIGGVWIAALARNLRHHPLLIRVDSKVEPETTEVAHEP